jgi:hypothetical protein
MENRDELIHIKADLAILKAKVSWMEKKVKLLDMKFFAYSVRRAFIKRCLRFWPLLVVFAMVFFAFGVVHDKQVFLKILGDTIGG